MGNPLSCAVARIMGLDWDKQFLQLVATLRTADPEEPLDLCALYQRYVDDQLGAHKAIPPGYRWNPTTMNLFYYLEFLEENEEKEPARRTMEILQQVANSINKRLPLSSP